MIINKSTSKLKPRTLIMHIGLPKTGTTMIQEFLKRYHATFEENGVGVLEVDGINAAHHLLANYLQKLDGANKSDGWFLGEDKRSNYYPTWTDQTTYLISAENMFCLREEGVLSVVKYAETNEAALKVACTLRNPSEWLWSVWTQTAKTTWMNWIDFIDSAIENRTGFLSTTLQCWLLKDQINSIVIVKYKKDGLLTSFLNRIAMDNIILLDDAIIPSVNIGVGIIEVLYGATMVKNIHQMLASNDRFGFEKVDCGYLERMLLGVSEKASPAFEIAQKYEDEAMNNELVLGTDSYQALSRYSEEWAKDARNFLKKARPWLDQESIKIIKELINEALEDAKRYIELPKNCRKLPQRNFSENLPIDAQFIGLSRTLATSILLGSKVFKTHISKGQTTINKNIIKDIFKKADINQELISEIEEIAEPSTKYIIAITPRSGSSHLCDVMKNTKL